MPETQVDFRTLRILLADDHAFIRNVIRGMLLRAGINNIHSAADTDEALEILRRRGNSVDCIISDWNMPPQGGLEFLRQVRLGAVVDVPTNTPFIMLTGHASSTVVTAALQLDVSAYIVKPASATKLIEAIRKATAKVWTAKAPRFYQSVNGIDLPATLDKTSEDPTTWAGWVKGGQQAILATGTEFVRRESVKLSQATPSDADELRNVRFRRVDRVKPGAILVEDFCDAEGNTLINAGAVLSETILGRLCAMQDSRGEKLKLWVGQRGSGGDD